VRSLPFDTPVADLEVALERALGRFGALAAPPAVELLADDAAAPPAPASVDGAPRLHAGRAIVEFEDPDAAKAAAAACTAKRVRPPGGGGAVISCC
jgi:hypothetical protein